jgi:hypothetical protein
LDSYSEADEANARRVEVAWTAKQDAVATAVNRKQL